MKLPPPATEFSAPPKAPARNKKMMIGSVKLLGVSESFRPAKWTNFYQIPTSELGATHNANPDSVLPRAFSSHSLCSRKIEACAKSLQSSTTETI